MVLEFSDRYRIVRVCTAGVTRGIVDRFRRPSNDTDSRSSLFERTVKRAAPRIWSVREKAAISLFCGVFFCIFVPVAGKNRNSDVFLRWV